MTKTPWAILLCKFNDNSTEPFGGGKTFYEQMFTSAGSGKQNMVDYFRDASHGNVDLSGTKVFGWFTLDKSRSDYKGSGANPKGRLELVGWAKQKALDSGVNLGDYYGVVVCMNVPTDLFGGGGQVVCDNDVDPGTGIAGMSPSLLGQEMGHGYGLDHSRADGSDADYMDQWDVMSTAGAFMTPHPHFTQRDARGRQMFWMGPLLNAANMSGRGWLDSARVWKSGEQEVGTHVQLRPLVRRDLAGYLAARVGEYLVEFRVQQGWDALIPRPAVLIHRFYGNHSYIMTGMSGQQDHAAGDKFESGNLDDPLAPGTRIDVLGIDVPNQTATLRVTVRRDRRPRVGPALEVIGGVSQDGGGLVIVGGKLVVIPPRSPLLEIVQQVAAAEESEHLASAAARDILRRDALAAIASQATLQLEKLQAYRTPTRVVPPSMPRAASGNLTSGSPVT